MPISAASARCSSSSAARALSASANQLSSTSKTAPGGAVSGRGACKSGSLRSSWISRRPARASARAWLSSPPNQSSSTSKTGLPAAARAATLRTAARRTRIGRAGRLTERAGRIARRLLGRDAAGQLLIERVEGGIERIEIIVRTRRGVFDRARGRLETGLIALAVAPSRACRSWTVTARGSVATGSVVVRGAVRGRDQATCGRGFGFGLQSQ